MRLLLFTLITVFLSSCDKNIPQFNHFNAFTLLEKQVAFGPRNPGSDGHLNCYNFLKTHLETFAKTVNVQTVPWHDKRFDADYDLKNIVASFYPEKTTRVLLAAHWDTNPIAEKDPDPEKQKLPILGANDGAAAVAVLLEIASIIAKDEPYYGIDIVLFDGEDLGSKDAIENYAIGSKAFAKVMTNYKPKFGVLIDLIGGKDLLLRREQYSQSQASHVVDRVWRAAEKLGYGDIFLNELGDGMMDDHVPLLEIGIPIIDVVDMEFVNDKGNIHHTHNDVVANCDPESLKIIGEVLLEVIYRDFND